jgi:hypothetical protein
MISACLHSVQYLPCPSPEIKKKPYKTIILPVVDVSEKLDPSL